MLIVYGSLNIDMMMSLPHLPKAGETVTAPSYEWMPGGKGANQALAAVLSGARKVAIVGKVGDDGFGTRALNNLRREGVMTSGVGHSDLPTGCAFIPVDQAGENSVFLALGANYEVTSDQVPDELLVPGNTILMQMEIPVENNWDVIRRANAKGARTILNLAPVGPVPEDVLNSLDILIFNEGEAQDYAALAGLETDNIPRAMARLARQYKLTVVLTMGRKGCLWLAPDGGGWGCKTLENIELVDTTGAGDTFIGVLAACLEEGKSVEDGLHRASVAAGLACEALGAQSATPRQSAIDEAMSRLAAPEAI